VAFTSRLPAYFSSVFESLGQPELTLARVVYGAGERARVQSNLHGSLTCNARRSLHVWPPVTGDWVAIDHVTASIEHVLPRQSEVARQAPGRATARQILAANMDWVFVIMALDQDFSVRRIERYLALCHAGRARPVVFLTKAGGGADVPRAIADVRSALHDVDVHAIDVVSGIAVEAPRAYLGEGATAALLGSSGVGKSTLVNHLLGRRASATQDVRESDGKGRHTTTGRELFVLQNGAAVIDTPGLREVALWTDEADIEATFPEMAALAAACRFRDCRHGPEPGCAVRAARERGQLSDDRVESYQKLLAESSGHRSRRMQQARKSQGRQHARLVRDVLTRKYGKDR
jgi:ribosome biogenesis GTPase